MELAWEIFGLKNGAASLAELRELLGPLAGRGTRLTQITCQVIANPVFFERRDWLPDPPGWSSNIVAGKMYRTEEADGATIWVHVLPLLRISANVTDDFGERDRFVGERLATRYDGVALACKTGVARHGTWATVRRLASAGFWRTGSAN